MREARAHALPCAQARARRPYSMRSLRIEPIELSSANANQKTPTSLQAFETGTARPHERPQNWSPELPR
eukprot:12390968-Alexandrium_andersonii.AAC.1